MHAYVVNESLAWVGGPQLKCEERAHYDIKTNRLVPRYLAKIANLANLYALSPEHVGRLPLVFALHAGCLGGNNRLML